MDRQAIARGHSAVLAFQVRIDGDYHERADEFAAALEFTGGSEHPKIRLCSGDFRAGIADSRGGVHGPVTAAASSRAHRHLHRDRRGGQGTSSGGRTSCGSIYLALMEHGCSLAQFEQLMAALVEAGRLRLAAGLLKLDDLGVEAGPVALLSMSGRSR